MGGPDYVIAGAGIIGLSLALELHRRGAKVVVIERERALAQASTAAAGMLAADDPGNPPALQDLAKLSVSLYPAFLAHVAERAGTLVPFQTTSTLQTVLPGQLDQQVLADPHRLVPQLVPGEHHFTRLAERSVDPRQLASALLSAVRNSSIDLREGAPLLRFASTKDGIRVETTSETLHAGSFIDCMGAWSPAPVAPCKGQMLAVALPKSLAFETVIRTETFYIVPRTEGPNAGRVIIGATVEDVGFNLEVHPLDILTLNAHATRLLPPLAEGVFLESWAGLRPATKDGLPILGATPRQPRYILANGHFRNGILLAPGTAQVIAQLLSGETPDINLAPFSPTRF